jgi:hypothetical protein
LTPVDRPAPIAVVGVASETHSTPLAYGFLVTKYITFIHIASQLEYIRILNSKCGNSISNSTRMTISTIRND